VTQACGFVGLSRQAYYQQRSRDQHADCLAQKVLAEVSGIRLQQPRLGTRKLHHLLRCSQSEHGIALGETVCLPF
jgi:putative transposase